MEYFRDRGTFSTVRFETVQAGFQLAYPSLVSDRGLKGRFPGRSHHRILGLRSSLVAYTRKQRASSWIERDYRVGRAICCAAAKKYLPGIDLCQHSDAGNSPEFTAEAQREKEGQMRPAFLDYNNFSWPAARLFVWRQQP
jgi:hypothetical protein